MRALKEIPSRKIREVSKGGRVWMYLKNRGVTIDILNPTILIEADAWYANCAASPNKRYGSAEHALYNTIMAPEKLRKHKESKARRAGKRYVNTGSSVPMDHHSRYNKHSPNRFTDRAIRRAQRSNVDHL